MTGYEGFVAHDWQAVPDGQTNQLLIDLQIDQPNNSQMCSGGSREHLLRRTAKDPEDVA